MPFPGFDTLVGVFTPTQERTLQQFVSYLVGWLGTQHKDDGSHGNITADSLDVNATVNPETGVTSTGAITADGTITADMDGDPVIIGPLAATGGFLNPLAGIDMRSTTTSRWRIGTTTSAGSTHQLLFEDLLGTAGAGGFTLRMYYDGTNYVLDHDAGVGFTVGIAGRRTTALYALMLDISTKFVVGTALAPAQIAANQNNYNPTGFLTSLTIFLNSDAGRDITGFAAGVDGQRIRLINNGNFTITLKHNSGSSSVGNKIIATGSADYLLVANASVDLEYQGANWWVTR